MPGAVDGLHTMKPARERTPVKQLIKSTLNRFRAAPLPIQLSTSLSDNQAYPQVCLQASSDYRFFNHFRRNNTYNQILEHATEEQGHEYLRHISRTSDLLQDIERFKPNDRFGNPRMYPYPGVGMCSPSTLRYIKVLADLKAHFVTLDNLRICEIGVGYGGQCRVINAYCRPASYTLVDIQPALALAQRFLDNYILSSTVSYRTMNALSPDEYDLVISNYAFTELPRAIQDVYLHKVLLNSRRGYITYNEITPVDFNSYKKHAIVEMISGSRVLPEEPLTHPGNCIIVWDNTTPDKSHHASPGLPQ